MNNQLLIKQLELFGLDSLEADIYLYLVENGPQTPLELSRELNIDRSKIYRSVDRLNLYKLLEESHSAWGKKLEAANPDNLHLFIDEKEQLLNSQKATLPGLIHHLQAVPAKHRREFEIKHYRGQEGLRQMLWNQLAAKKEILAFSYRNKNDIAGKIYADKIRTEQMERKIMLYELENETDQGDFWYTSVPGWQKFYRSRHISPDQLDIKHYIAIFNDTVAIVNWLDKEEVGLEIVNHTYAEMQSQIFWQFWKLAGRQKSG